MPFGRHQHWGGFGKYSLPPTRPRVMEFALRYRFYSSSKPKRPVAVCLRVFPFSRGQPGKSSCVQNTQLARAITCDILTLPATGAFFARVALSGRSAAWLARLVRDQGVDGSNPFAPTIFLQTNQILASGLLSALSMCFPAFRRAKYFIINRRYCIICSFLSIASRYDYVLSSSPAGGLAA